jgi:hypothetical protein
VSWHGGSRAWALAELDQNVDGKSHCACSPAHGACYQGTAFFEDARHTTIPL